MWLGFNPTPPEVLEERLRERQAPNRFLHCKGCHTRIANLRDAFRWEGQSPYHLFKNSAGFSFTLILVHQAEALQDRSPAILEDTWFPGFAWVIQNCQQCNLHLGWRYVREPGGLPQFFGLIRDRLTVV